MLSPGQPDDARSHPAVQRPFSDCLFPHRGGAGTDAALETADIALMGDDLSKLPYTVALSRKTLSIIKQNISFALGLKLLALLLVIPGWLTLWIAIFADMGATLIVTLNSLRLIRSKYISA